VGRKKILLPTIFLLAALIFALFFRNKIFNPGEARTPALYLTPAIETEDFPLNSFFNFNNKTFINSSGSFQFQYPRDWLLEEKKLNNDLVLQGITEAWSVSSLANLDLKKIPDESARIDFEISAVLGDQDLEKLACGQKTIPCEDAFINGIRYKRVIFKNKKGELSAAFITIKNGKIYKATISLLTKSSSSPLRRQVDELINSFRILK